MKKIATAFLGLLVLAPHVRAAEIIPVTVAQFSTGQWYFEGEKSSLAGNASLQFVPAVKFPTGFSLLPTFESNYRGTRSAEELVGGNTLFQDTWENGVGLKTVKEFSDEWVARTRLSGRMKWFRETSDESWGDGLYDYRSGMLGGEMERRWERASVAAGYDFSLLQFTNYDSLESTQGGDSAREFAGDKVLDSTIHILSLRTQAALPWRLQGGVQAYYSPRMYDEQTVVVRSGLLSSSKREDKTSGATLSLDRSFRAPMSSVFAVSLLYGYVKMDSNQNHYDARVTTFINDFYDYRQDSVGAQFRLGFGKNPNGAMVAEVGGSYSNRDYPSRVIQDADGNYLSEKLHVTDTSLNLGFSYPLTRNFRARVSSTFGRSRSNNDYEAVYRYNYSNANYQFGFTYEY